MAINNSGTVDTTFVELLVKTNKLSAQQNAIGSTIIAVLVRMNKLSERDRDEATNIAANLQIHPAEVILRGNFVSSRDYDLALAAALMLDQDLICPVLLLQGFQQASMKGTSLEEGLKYFGFGW